MSWLKSVGSSPQPRPITYNSDERHELAGAIKIPGGHWVATIDGVVQESLGSYYSEGAAKGAARRVLKEGRHER